MAEWKGPILRTKIVMVGVLVALLAAGCKTLRVGKGDGGEASSKDRLLLTVDFEPGQTLRYKFVSGRQIILDWDPNAAGGAGKRTCHVCRCSLPSFQPKARG